MSNIGLTKEIIHPQWGAPMSFHVLVRVEHDLISKDSYLSFASYYNKQVYDNGGMPMSNAAVHIPNSELGTQEEFINAVIEDPDNEFTGGILNISEEE